MPAKRITSGRSSSSRKSTGKSKSFLTKIANAMNNKGFTRGFKKGFEGTIRVGKKYVAPLSRLAAGMITGSGDYGYMTDRKKTAKRSFAHVRMEKGEMVIEHSEYIGELIVPPVNLGAPSTSAASAWNTQQYGINPGNQGLFPWLSSVACNFQEWKADKIVLEYVPLVSESTTSANGTLTTMGSCVLSTQYNSNAGPYNSKQAAAESDFAVTGKPSQSLRHAVECDVKYNPLGVMYVSPSANTQSAGNYDVRMQNLGIFQASTNGMPIQSPAGGNSSPAIDCGELWIHYKIRLMKPVFGSPYALQSAHYYASSVNNTGAITNTQPFGATVASNAQPYPAVPPYLNPYSGMPIVQPNLLQLLFGNLGGITFPLNITTGRYLFVYRMAGTTPSAAAPLPVLLNFVNCSAFQLWSSAGNLNDNRVLGDAPATSQTGFMAAWFIDVNAPGAQLASFGFQASAALPAANTFMELWVTESNLGQY